MSETAVSIIIPCYNKAPYIAVAIESALEQTHPCEVIVVDDGSTDGSRDVIARYHDRITWTSGPNRGGSAARNTGVAMASGDWIQFLDADDRMAPDKVARQLEALQGAPKGSIACCGWHYFHDDGHEDAPSPRRYWKSFAPGEEMLLEMWLHGGFFPPHCWLIPKDINALREGWNTDLTGDDDGEFFARVMLEAPEIRFVDRPLAHYRNPPPGSVSSDRSLASARSFLAAYERVSSRIRATRWDRAARRACLSRLRYTAYRWRHMPEVVEQAASMEREIGASGFSPSLPRLTRGLVGLLGIGLGLRLRRALDAH